MVSTLPRLSALLGRSIALAACAVALQSASASAQADRGGMPGDFDYYILALSWSPTYCDQRGGDDRGEGFQDRSDGNEDRRGYGRNRRDADEQCSGVRPYAFVLHGLWPQYERRGWPEACQTRERAWVSEETIDRMMDIMPSRRLVIQEYRRHGTCSGLDPQGYFEAARRAYRSIQIPEQFRELSNPLTLSPGDILKAFVAANPQLAPDMVQVVCARNLLRELRICLSKDLQPRSCSAGESRRRLCRYDTVTLPPVRGGGVGPHGGPSDRDRM